jgi:hypothetical protein
MVVMTIAQEMQSRLLASPQQWNFEILDDFHVRAICRTEGGIYEDVFDRDMRLERGCAMQLHVVKAARIYIMLPSEQEAFYRSNYCLGDDGVLR